MVMWTMSDRGIPRSLRFMEGYGVHTFRFVNAEGESRFVKFHWKPKGGLQSVLWDEAVKINGADPDFHRRDIPELHDGAEGPVSCQPKPATSGNSPARSLLGSDLVPPSMRDCGVWLRGWRPSVTRPSGRRSAAIRSARRARLGAFCPKAWPFRFLPALTKPRCRRGAASQCGLPSPSRRAIAPGGQQLCHRREGPLHHPWREGQISLSRCP